LITGILVDSFGKQGFFRDFIARRSLRVFPLYYFFLLISFTVVPGLLEWLAGNDANTASGASLFPWFTFYVANYLNFIHDPTVAAWIGTSPDSVSVPEHLAVTWSLCVEEQFYLVWPLLLLVIYRFPLRAILLMIAGVILCRAWVVISLGNWQQVSYMATFCRADSLLLGAAAAVYLRCPAFSLRLWRSFSLAAAFFVLPAMMIWIIASGGRGDSTFAAVGYTLVAFGFVGWLGVTLCSKQMALKSGDAVDSQREAISESPRVVLRHLIQMPCTIFESRILRWFGKYSYGLYLYHMIVLACSHAWRPAHTLPNGSVADQNLYEPIGGSMMVDAPVRTLLVLAVTMGIAWCSYRWLESPFLNLKRFFESKDAGERFRERAAEEKVPGDLVTNRELSEMMSCVEMKST
jgi:peptidoglycan/LPS O-acetylase OafA/YrhL